MQAQWYQAAHQSTCHAHHRYAVGQLQTPLLVGIKASWSFVSACPRSAGCCESSVLYCTLCYHGVGTVVFGLYIFNVSYRVVSICRWVEVKHLAQLGLCRLALNVFGIQSWRPPKRRPPPPKAKLSVPSIAPRHSWKPIQSTIDPSCSVANIS